MNILYIGDYLGPRFRTHSFWPPNGKHVPIRSNAMLLKFLNTRRDVPSLKKNLMDWLTIILENERSHECIPTKHKDYYIRKVNKFGWNSVIQFLRDNLTNENVIKKLPGLKRNRTTGHLC